MTDLTRLRESKAAYEAETKVARTAREQENKRWKAESFEAGVVWARDAASYKEVFDLINNPDRVGRVSVQWGTGFVRVWPGSDHDFEPFRAGAKSVLDELEPPPLRVMARF
jgi:hypothetical protein